MYENTGYVWQNDPYWARFMAQLKRDRTLRRVALMTRDVVRRRRVMR